MDAGPWYRNGFGFNLTKLFKFNHAQVKKIIIIIIDSQSNSLWFNLLDRFWNAGLSAEVVAVMAKALCESSVTRLHLDWNPFPHEEDSKCLADLCSKESSVRILSLRGNALSDEAVKPLFEAISNDSPLTALNLGSKCIICQCRFGNKLLIKVDCRQ